MKSRKFFTIPNILTLIRISLIPVIIVVFFSFPDKPLLPAAIFCAAAATDLIDGLIAKKFNMVSDIGKVLDPLADGCFSTPFAVLRDKDGNIFNGAACDKRFKRTVYDYLRHAAI